MPARTMVELLTLGGARVLGLSDRIGSLEVGKRADVVCLSLDAPHAVPVYDPWAHVAYAARAADVRHVVIDGRVVVQDGQLLTVDEAPLRAAAREVVSRLRASS
jgi:5-methylthioadenosine/S-adenosylhomocysteine deaminase